MGPQGPATSPATRSGQEPDGPVERAARARGLAECLRNQPALNPHSERQLQEVEDCEHCRVVHER
eukprot:15247224-Alexandrium_andersonii.AAC.1